MLLKHYDQQLTKLRCWNTNFNKAIFFCFRCVKTEHCSVQFYFYPMAKQSITFFSVLLFRNYHKFPKQSITLCSHFFCFEIYHKIPNNGNRVFFHSILFGMTRNSRHGTRACPGSLKTSKQLKECFLLQQIIQQSENVVKVFLRLAFCVVVENN